MEDNYVKDEGQYTPSNQQSVPEFSSHLGLAIFTTIMCCVPFGIVAIIKASMANNFFDRGEYADALKASKDAKKWALIGVGAGVVLWIFIIIYYVSIFAMFAAESSTNSYY